jgi:hypothetical protein
MNFDWGVPYTIGKIFLRVIKYFAFHAPNRLDLRKI